MQAEVKDAYWKIFGTEDLKTRPGPRLVEIIDARIGEFAARYQALYPAAVKCLLTDREGLTAYLRFPAEHRNRIRHSNFIERTFGETRRRVKVIGRLPGETSCLTLVWAVLDRASVGWRGFTMTSDGLRLLQDLRRQLLQPPVSLRRSSPPGGERPAGSGPSCGVNHESGSPAGAGFDAARPSRLPVVSAELAKELPHVAGQQVGCFQGGEVAAAGELGPVHDVVVAFGQRPEGDVVGEHRHSGGYRGLRPGLGLSI